MAFELGNVEFNPRQRESFTVLQALESQRQTYRLYTKRMQEPEFLRTKAEASKRYAVAIERADEEVETIIRPYSPSGTPYFITSDITTMLVEIAATFPDNIPLQRTDLPNHHMHCFFQNPIMFAPYDVEVREFINGFTLSFSEAEGAVYLDMIAMVDERRSLVTRSVFADKWLEGTAIADYYASIRERLADWEARPYYRNITQGKIAAGYIMRHLVFTLFRFIDDKIIRVEPEQHQLEETFTTKKKGRYKQHRRNYQRDIHVVSLRRIDRRIKRRGGKRNYQHRWMVRGHWRHLQARTLRDGTVKPAKVTWVRPHIKGPAGKPFTQPKSIYVVER